MNKHWARWIFASVNKHFNTKIFTDNALFLFIEGMDRDSAGATNDDGGKVISTADLNDFAEFRTDGPQIKQHSKNDFEINIAVNILLKATMSNDIHKIQKYVGIAEAAFTNCIEVKRYGDPAETAENDSQTLGFLMLRTDSTERIRTNHFGQIREDLKVLQATVEGHYRMFLRG